MKAFIITLMLSKICNFYAARRYREFRGSSKHMYNYLLFSTGIGGLIVDVAFVWACFLTTWWIPIAAFFVAYLIAPYVVPCNLIAEFVCALLWAVFFIISVILMLLQ